MTKRHRNHIEWGMAHHGLVFFLIAVFVIMGLFALPMLKKDEFPQFTIRLGVVAAIYPGATAEEIEEQVTKPLEDFLFTYEEINKSKTRSVTEDGVVYVYTELRDDIVHKDEVWAKIRAGLNLFKLTKLPQGVLQVVLVDDFGSTSTMLLAVESDERSPRELEEYSRLLAGRLRDIPEMGKINIIGTQQEEIAVNIDMAALSSYGVNQSSLMAMMTTQGLRSMSGTLPESGMGVHVDIPFRSEQEVADQIVLVDPKDGHVLRLGDVADVERRYKEQKKFINFYEGDGEKPSSCLVIDIQMAGDNNIVEFGEKVDNVIKEVALELPPDVKMHRITDQPKVVDNSVKSFLGDILLSMLVVVAVMLLLFPFKTSLVASTGVPICTAITLAVMYFANIQLNTVTLAALIVVLGMIVDNSVIVVDGYMNMISDGHSHWYSASVSTKELFVPMVIATMSISGMFFPMTGILTGIMKDFVQLFPWTVLFALTISIIYAVYVTPYLAARFISSPIPEKQNFIERAQSRFFEWLQRMYEHVLGFCFRHAWLTLGFTIALIAFGLVLFLTRINVQMLPKADRAMFAVEIHLPAGTKIDETTAVADSLARMLTHDKRVKNITSFVGQSSPRFHATYSPAMAATNYAQFIVNTSSIEATAQLIREMTPKYENYFPNAYIRFKQMDYQVANNPVEIYLQGDDLDEMALYADSLKAYMDSMEELQWVHSDYDEYKSVVRVRLKEEEAGRYGVTQTLLSTYLASALDGVPLTTIYEAEQSLPVMLYGSDATEMDCQSVSDMLIPTAVPGVWVPINQVAEVRPGWHHASITHLNGHRTITVAADMAGRASQPAANKKIWNYIESHGAQEFDIKSGGLTKLNGDLMPQIALSVVGALVVMFVVLLLHFGRISISLLTLSTALLTLFGAFFGMWLFGLDFSITAVLGVVSLIGVIVRNAIIMFEYADDLRFGTAGLTVKQAAYQAGLRRMRPIFLTSATTALGVIPMIIAGTGLWMPLGVTICFGTIFTLPLVVTVLPVLYWKVFSRSGRKRKRGRVLKAAPATASSAEN